MAKLKGKMAEKLSKEKKAKMQATLDRMVKTRAEDSIFLREYIKEKKQWAEEQFKKAGEAITARLEAIEKLEQEITEFKVKRYELNGVLLILKNLESAKKGSDE